MIKINIILLFGVGIFYLYSCSPIGILGGATTSTMVIAEGDRSLGSVVDDTTIKINISAKFLKSDNNLFINVGSNVIEGRVLLTGLVETQEVRIDAVRLVWEVGGVKEVINEIVVGSNSTIKEYASDLWINTQAKALTAKTVGLRSLSYNFETIKGKVYIAGITSRPEQLDDIIKVIKTIKGVKEIVNYVILKE